MPDIKDIKLSDSNLLLEGTPKEQDEWSALIDKRLEALKPDQMDRAKIYRVRKNFYTGQQSSYTTIVGRVSKEKNIEDFCELDILHSTKVVVGDGPYRETLQKKYNDVEFVGYKFGTELAEFYRNSDVLVFPSTVDTYGIVMLEAMACGTPCAGYNVTGPIDQIKNGINGYTDDELELAVEICFELDREGVYNTVKHKNWKNSATQFVKYTTI